MHHWSFLYLFPASADQPVGDVHRMLPIDITPQVFSLAEEDVQRKIWGAHDNRCAGMQKITTTLGEARFPEGVPIFLRKN